MLEKNARGSARGNEQGTVQEQSEGFRAELAPEQNEQAENAHSVVPREELLKVIDERRKLKEKLRRLENQLGEVERRQEDQRLRELSSSEDIVRVRQEFSERLQNAQQSAREWEDRYKSERIRHSIFAEATRHNAYNPEQILRLLTPDLTLDEAGEPVFKDGRSLGDGLREFCSRKENRNLLKPSGLGGGAGSSSAVNSREPLEDARQRAVQSGRNHDIVNYQKMKRNATK